MSLPRVATRDEWLAARKDLLDEEKELTRRRDALNAKRRELPMVEVTEPYRLTGPDGAVSLLELFDGRRQLIVYHFMYDPDWDVGCSSCTAGIDELNEGFLDHLHVRDTSLAMVSRAPIEKLEAWRAKQGWDHLRWVSSAGTSFNHDFGVTIDESAGASTYNFRSLDEWQAATGEPFAPDQPMELPGRSCFLRVADRIFHTYSQYARGLESTGGSYYFLDLTALGRQEDWEEPEGRTASARLARPDFAE